MMPALLPSSTLIFDCRAPSDSRMLARFRRSASACFRIYSHPGVRHSVSTRRQRCPCAAAVVRLARLPHGAAPAPTLERTACHARRSC